MKDPVQKSVLPNGLRVVTVELPHLHTGMIAAYVRAGSRHEDPAHNGVSHFLEHLFFRGSEAYPEGRAMNALVEDCGGSLNGVTTRDHGYYFSPVHPERLEVPIAVLGDMLARPLFKEVELEREVILEEILDEVDTDGRDIDIDNLSKRALFPGHPLGLKIAGTRETVGALTEEHVRAQHARAYGARNLVLAAAGPLRHDRVLDLAHKHFASLRPGEALGDTELNGAPRGPQLVAVDHTESQMEVQVSFRTPPEEHADFPMLRVLADLRDADVPEDELLRAKNKSRIWLEFSLDSPAEMIGWFGAGELLRPPAESFESWLSRVERVTAADVRRVANGVFRRENLVACAVGPLSGLEKKLRAAVESAL